MLWPNKYSFNHNMWDRQALHWLVSRASRLSAHLRTSRVDGLKDKTNAPNTKTEGTSRTQLEPSETIKILFLTGCFSELSPSCCQWNRCRFAVVVKKAGGSEHQQLWGEEEPQKTTLIGCENINHEKKNWSDQWRRLSLTHWLYKNDGQPRGLQNLKHLDPLHVGRWNVLGQPLGHVSHDYFPLVPCDWSLPPALSDYLAPPWCVPPVSCFLHHPRSSLLGF